MYPVWQKEQVHKYIDTFHTDWDIFGIETCYDTRVEPLYKLSKLDIRNILSWLDRQVFLSSQHAAPKLTRLHQSTAGAENHAQHVIQTSPDSKKRVTLL